MACPVHAVHARNNASAGATSERPNIGLRQILKPGLIRDEWLILAGVIEQKQSWVHHTFTEYAIGFISSGHGTYQANAGPVQKIAPGTLFFVYPGPLFHYGPDPGTHWCEYHFGLGGPRFHQLRKMGLFETDGLVSRLSNITAIVERFRELIGVVRNAQLGNADRAVLLAERLLLELYYSRSTFQTAVTLNTPLETILQYCREHLDEPIDFEQLATRHAMSYSSLRQGIRKRTGLGPARYLTALRCDTARKLLSESELSVKEIGARTGFEDPYTFSRVFKRNVGVSPRFFRRQAAVWSAR